MKYVFFGSPEFARTVLEKLLDAKLVPAAVVTNPDRPAGRKQVITPPPVKQLVRERGLESEVAVLQPEKLDEAFRARLSALTPDVFVVAAYAKIIPASTLAIARLGSVGVHPSLLPLYRGASPIQSALLAGETETGVTLYLLDEKMDNGPVLAAVRVPVSENDAYPSLMRKLAAAGGELLATVLPRYAAGEVQPMPQDSAKATITRKFTAEDGFVEEAALEAAMRGAAPDEAQHIARLMRALGAEPGVWTVKNGKRLKLLEAAVRDGRLVLLTAQWEGKKPGPFTG